MQNADCAFYQPQIMQALDAAQASGGRKVAAFGQLLIGQAGIGLQVLQQPPIGGIQRGDSGGLHNYFENLYFLKENSKFGFFCNFISF